MKWLEFGLIFIAIPLLASCGSAVKKAKDQNSTDPVVEERSLWHNWSSAYDINEDGYVTPRDVLNIINTLNLDGERGLPASAYHTGMYHYDANLDGFVSVIDAYLVMAEINRVSNDQSPRNHSEDPATRAYELSFDTAKLFYRFCRVEPVEEVNGARPSGGRRWFQSKVTREDGSHVYFVVMPTGEMYRLTSESMRNVDKFIAKLDMSLFDHTDDPFHTSFVTDAQENPYSCPREQQ
ncbi:MAG: hypothetical protein KDD51_03400 [Bdellovibrionales bacterium]|nr:hypothetical protein [Bdellovibrionales bacterium]